MGAGAIFSRQAIVGFLHGGGGNSGKISFKTKRTTFPPEEENIKFRKPGRPTPMAA